ncbi:hypothetical protein VPH35_038959 [Triticum aestivum]|uniref:Uncharacterized protein n=1 Tax=Aegilops tauschii TaxID=37682 RepID=N1R2K8_AEGTA
MTSAREAAAMVMPARWRREGGGVILHERQVVQDAATRVMTITTPKKHEKEISPTESALPKDENVEPLVAFSRPPPLPPVLGPLIALSLFQTSSSDEDSK